MTRLASHLQVSALTRLAEAKGGNGAVLARGDRESGGILLFLADRGVLLARFERVSEISGAVRWQRTPAQDVEGYEELNSYISRRRRADPDLWVVELDVAGAERFAAETLGAG